MLAALLATTFALVSVDPPLDPRIDAAIAHLAKATREVVDVKCVFTRQDWVDGAMKPRESIELACRKPGDLSMRWRDGPEKGRVLVYRAGASTMKVKDLLTLDLDPDGAIARHNERHTIKDAPPLVVAKHILDDVARTQKYGGTTTALLPKHDVNGAPATCWSAQQRRDLHPDFYAERAEICVDDATGLPSMVRVWNHEDGALRLVEDYTYTSITVNTKLDDAAFTL